MVTAVADALAPDLLAKALALVESVGFECMVETLGCSEAELLMLLEGSSAGTPEVRSALEDLFRMMDDAAADAGLEVTAPVNSGHLPSPVPVVAEAGPPAMGDPVHALYPGAGSVAPDPDSASWQSFPSVESAAADARKRGGVSYGASRSERCKEELYRYLEVLVRRQYDVTLSEERRLAMYAYRLEIELTIIDYYKDTVPVSGLNWDEATRRAELDYRSGRLAMAWEHQKKAERFFSRVKRILGFSGNLALVREVAREAALLEEPVDGDEAVKQILSRSNFGRMLLKDGGGGLTAAD